MSSLLHRLVLLTLLWSHSVAAFVCHSRRMRFYLHLPAQKTDEDILARFTNPTIDDPFLPLVDVSVAQIVAPSLQICWLSLVHAPSPGWLRPLFANDQLVVARGSLLAPTLIHGAALAVCWVIGALAAKAYERPAVVPASASVAGYAKILWSLVKAGAFATGLLIFATQLDLFLEFGRIVGAGESAETDFRLLTALVEVLNDVVFEAVSLLAWRLFLATQNSPR